MTESLTTKADSTTTQHEDIKNAVDITKELYLSSEQYKEDVEYYEDHRRDSL